MPSFLIKVTWGKWQTDPPWLKPGELQASALFDLRFKNNELSIWEIEDDSSNLERVIAALAASRQSSSIDEVDYVILEEAAIKKLNIKMQKSPGATPDQHANDRWHYNLAELSVNAIVAIAACLKAEGRFQRSAPTKTKLAVAKGVQGRNINIDLADEKLKPALRLLEQMKLPAK